MKYKSVDCVVPAILVVLGRVILFCFGSGILVGLLIQFREYQETPLTAAERRDIPWLLLGGLLVVIYATVAVLMILLAFTA